LCPGSGRGCTYEDKKAALQCGTIVDSSKPVPSFSLHCSARLLELPKALFLSRWPGEDLTRLGFLTMNVWGDDFADDSPLFDFYLYLYDTMIFALTWKAKHISK